MNGLYNSVPPICQRCYISYMSGNQRVAIFIIIQCIQEMLEDTKGR
jgi:hypothetical protein